MQHYSSFQTNDMLVASLLRLKDNSCNVIETEKILRNKNKFFELFILYERKSMHAEGKTIHVLLFLCTVQYVSNI